MTLNRVATRSKGRFKPSSIGGYERGERAVSLERFCLLSDVYCIPADQLLSSVLDGMYPVRQQRISLDLSRLSSVGIDRVRLVAQFVHRIRALRGDYLTDVISLRSGDLQALALESAVEHAELLTTLEPAVRTDGDLK